MEQLPSGRIRDVKLPHLLRLLQQGKRTGVLTLRRNDQERSIYIQEGDIIFATSRYEDDRLGEMLLRSGRINLEQYEKSVQLLKTTGKRQGTILVEEGFIGPKDLFEAVLTQVKGIILSLFTWIDGEYRFAEGSLPTDEVITLKMSTGNLILDGTRRITDWTRLCREIPPLETVLRVGTDPRNLFQDIQLMDQETALLGQVDRRKTIRDLFKVSPLPALHTMQMVHFFLSSGILEIAESQTTQEAPSLGAGRAAGGEQSSSVEEAIRQAVMEEKRGNVEDSKTEIFHQDEARRANRERIEQAYGAMQGQDHYQVLNVSREATSDQIKRAYFRLAKEYHPDRHLQEGMSNMYDKLEALFRRITEAYDTLLMEQTRKEYDMSLVMGSLKRKRSRPAGAQAEGQQLSSEEQAVQQYERAQQAFQRGDYSQVVYCMEWALRLMPEKGDYHGLMGQALMQVNGKLREAEDAFKKAIEADPSNPTRVITSGWAGSIKKGD